MHEHSATANPFELMMNPEAVLQAMARSDRLERLQRRVCRPLDKPAAAHKAPETEAFDSAIESQAATDPDPGAERT